MEPITQFILLAGGVGAEDWANILVIAVMAILWLVAGLIRTISKKGPQQEQPEPEGSTGQPRRPGESWHQRLARKAEELQRRLEEQAGVREPGKPRPPARETATRSPQAPGGKISVRPGRQGDSVVAIHPARASCRPPAHDGGVADPHGCTSRSVEAGRRTAEPSRLRQFRASRYHRLRRSGRPEKGHPSLRDSRQASGPSRHARTKHRVLSIAIPVFSTGAEDWVHSPPTALLGTFMGRCPWWASRLVSVRCFAPPKERRPAGTARSRPSLHRSSSPGQDPAGS
jgi:hypothetical protein